MAYETLRRALATLDAISARGGGQLVVVPQPVGQALNRAHQGVTYIAWPQVDYNAIASEWARMGYYGGPKTPFAQGTDVDNADIAPLLDNPNSWLVGLSALRAGVTVDQARERIRARLIAEHVSTTAPPPPTPPRKPFPWGWCLGTLGLGTGIMLAIIFHDPGVEQ